MRYVVTYLKKAIKCIVLCLISMLLSCSSEPDKVSIAVTNSWLESVLRDIYRGSEHPIEIIRLAEPGSCPGHFDLSPKDFKALERCHTLIRFDFQQSLDSKLTQLRKNGLRVLEIPAPHSFNIPSQYLDVCEMIHRDLNLPNPLDKSRIEYLADFADEYAQREYKGTRVVSSGMQKAFCEYLGFEVIATYSGGAEAATPAMLESLIEQGRSANVTLVIANRQEGIQMAEALAVKLNARLVVLSNFPAMTSSEMSVVDLIKNNLISIGPLKPGSSQTFQFSA